MATTISEVMTRDPISVRPEASVSEAAAVMRESAVGDVLVVDDSGLRGIVTDRDIVVRCVADGGQPDEIRVADVCTPDPVTLDVNASIDDAIARLRGEAVRRLPVVEGDAIVGMVSIGDLAVERDPDSTLADISTAPPDSAG